MSRFAGDPGSSPDAAAVFALVLQERQSRDRGWWGDMSACFADDAVIEMSWFNGPAREFIDQTRERSTAGVWGRHRLSPPAVRVQGDRAWAELPLGIEFPISVEGVDGDLVSYCRSGYRAEKTDGSWRLTRIKSVYERDTLTASVPGTRLPVDARAFDGFRPSYRCLAWYFARRGTPLPDDLLGDDRPDPVAAYYAEERSWVEGELLDPETAAGSAGGG